MSRILPGTLKQGEGVSRFITRFSSDAKKKCHYLISTLLNFSDFLVLNFEYFFLVIFGFSLVLKNETFCDGLAFFDDFFREAYDA